MSPVPRSSPTGSTRSRLEQLADSRAIGQRNRAGERRTLGPCAGRICRARQPQPYIGMRVTSFGDVRGRTSRAPPTPPPERRTVRVHCSKRKRCCPSAEGTLSRSASAVKRAASNVRIRSRFHGGGSWTARIHESSSLCLRRSWAIVSLRRGVPSVMAAAGHFLQAVAFLAAGRAMYGAPSISRDV